MVSAILRMIILKEHLHIENEKQMINRKIANNIMDNLNEVTWSTILSEFT